MAQGSILGAPQQIIFDAAEIYRQHWLEESGQRLENVDQTHQVLASDKVVLQKGTIKSLLPQTSGCSRR